MNLPNAFFLLEFFSAGLILGSIYGVAFYKYHFFPYQSIKDLRMFLKNESPYGPWSIGLYAGEEMFNLSDAPGVLNPIMTGEDVNDIDAEFVADPFFVIDNEKYYLFFEVMNRSNKLGEIAYAMSEDGISWEYKRVVLNEKIHLSYPYVFKWEDQYYMIPETHQDLSVRLYKAASFPEKWEYIGNLLDGYHYTDASIFRYDDMWWLFVSNTHNDVLNLYWSRDLLSGWMSHPMNPILKFDKHLSRPAGRVVVDGTRIFRFAQDDYPSYGIQVFAFEITELTATSYTEILVSEEPLLFPKEDKWNDAGMHHIDLQNIKGRWLAMVDGRTGLFQSQTENKAKLSLASKKRRAEARLSNLSNKVTLIVKTTDRQS